MFLGRGGRWIGERQVSPTFNSMPTRNKKLRKIVVIVLVLEKCFHLLHNFSVKIPSVAN